jgi:hypothetical protein
MMLPTFSDLVTCAPTLETQITLTVLQATFWAVAIPVIARKAGKWIKTKSWCDRWTALQKDTQKKVLFVEFDNDEDALDLATLIVGILAQQLVGGMLAAVAVFLPVSSAVATTFAGHGALCEVGWELQDVVTPTCQIAFGGAKGKAKNPTSLLVILGIHHSMGLGMGIPAIMSRFADLPEFHEMIFLLQFAAAAALLTQNYGFTLNVRVARELMCMKMQVAFTFAMMFYSRVFRFAILGYRMMSVFWASGSMSFVYGGGAVFGLMGLLNILFALDAYGKFAKFIKMQPVEKGLEKPVAPCCPIDSDQSALKPLTAWKSEEKADMSSDDEASADEGSIGCSPVSELNTPASEHSRPGLFKRRVACRD